MGWFGVIFRTIFGNCHGNRLPAVMPFHPTWPLAAPVVVHWWPLHWGQAYNPGISSKWSSSTLVHYITFRGLKKMMGWWVCSTCFFCDVEGGFFLANSGTAGFEKLKLTENLWSLPNSTLVVHSRRKELTILLFGTWILTFVFGKDPKDIIDFLFYFGYWHGSVFVLCFFVCLKCFLTWNGMVNKNAIA